MCLRLSGLAARWIKSARVHHSQKILEQSSGQVTIQLRVAITGELCSWIMSQGPNIQVLEPKSLRERVGEIARQTAENLAST